MTSLNAVVITIKLGVSLLVQRLLALYVGEGGIAKIGQLRNLIEMVTSSSCLGTFNGVVKYVSEFKEDTKTINQLFSTVFSFLFIGSLITTLVVFFNSQWISKVIFGDLTYVFLIKIFSLSTFFIAVNRVFYAVIHGLSSYKEYAKVDLVAYILAAFLLVVELYYYNIEGVLYAIVLAPIIQLGVIIFVFGSTLKKYIKKQVFQFKFPLAKELLAFTLMSFISTVLLNYVELDIRTMITNKISINEAGYWTAMSFISKNYMAFSSSLFTLYVIPKFSRIYTASHFKTEVIKIYKTMLPLFGIGMLLVYVLRYLIIEIVYPNFTGMEGLFKWQLLGDFIRLGALVLSHQFLAKKMVKSFIVTEIISITLFYFLSKYLVGFFGVEGVVMAHFYRYILYFIIVLGAIWFNFYKIEEAQGIKNDNEKH